jgi:hypothetical protein
MPRQHDTNNPYVVICSGWLPLSPTCPQIDTEGAAADKKLSQHSRLCLLPKRPAIESGRVIACFDVHISEAIPMIRTNLMSRLVLPVLDSDLCRLATLSLS